VLDDLRRFKAGIFKALAHPVRVGVVEYLQFGELTAARLAEKLGVTEARLARHLAVLVARNVVTARSGPGGPVYALRDPTLGKVLTDLRAYFFAHLSEALAQLRAEQDEADSLDGDSSPDR
jgi:DNA-binding transcriptional ArsR family regulator